MAYYLLDDSCFNSVQNYTTLKQSTFRSSGSKGFNSVQNYTTLKQITAPLAAVRSFNSVQNYTTLKLPID